MATLRIISKPQVKPVPASVQKEVKAEVRAAEVPDAPPMLQGSIPVNREHDYTHLYFKDGDPVLQGLVLPLDPLPFKMKRDLSATKYWRDVLAAYGLDTRNISLAKE